MSLSDLLDAKDAEIARLREALQGVLWMAEEWLKHGGDETTFADDYKKSVAEANAVLTGSQSNNSDFALVVLGNLVEEYDAWPAPKPQFESYSICHARGLIAKHKAALQEPKP